ncbi:MAG TPA: MFS transporter [Proteiniclasticum sp.]|jgi:Na+/melibiose symporter-like transporter|uniref:MFS transporter n=1 Tax=Proteiniclasticum sp. TaxID=2053595 RepID=UPI000E7D8F33|nr:MFS transporter [Proteiniclasticum sp.]HBW13750.1 MFS transporter [Proteiniclasticum sp.]
MEHKLDYKKTFTLGFGFFAISITWSVYNAFMPLLLGNYLKSAALIGFIMTIDNYLALFIQPAVGFYSDKINTRFGRRMPFIMVGMPLAAVFMFLIPQTKSLYALVFALLFMNLSMSIYRSPVIALMPDITAKQHRSKSNSIINFMGGIGSLIAYLIGGRLFELNEGYPFILSSFLILFSFGVLFLKIKEHRDVLHYESAEEKRNLIQGLGIAWKDKNARNLLFAICSWFIAYNGIETFFTKYGQSYLGIQPAQATTTLAFISLSFLVFAIPAGIIGTKIGKKNTIRMGVGLAVILTLALYLLKPQQSNMLLYMRILFLGVGFAWASININSYPLVADMSPLGLLGTYTGVYYLFSSIANIISPVLLGFLIDVIGYQVVFLYGAFFFGLAFFFISQVHDKRAENGND